MTWDVATFDTATGVVGAPVDVGGLSWSVSVSDCSLTVDRKRDVGDDAVSSVSLPWEAVPGTDAQSRHDAVAPLRRGLVLSLDGVPVVAGAVGERADTWEGTSFALLSPMDLLSMRYIVREGTFGKGSTVVEEGEQAGQTVHDVTVSEVAYKNLSLRAIAADLVRLATSAKPGGWLPIEEPAFAGERGAHQRTYPGFNVANNDCAKLLDAITNVDGGPDIQFRPRLDGAGALRWTMEAGSDGEPYLGTKGPVPTLTCFPGGGTAQSLECATLAPAMRVYGTGSGQDRATLCHLSEDLSLCRRRDPWPLVEATVSGSSDWDNIGLVRSHTDAALSARKVPLVQLRCEVDVSDQRNPVVPGRVWPGQRVDIDLDGHPALPDGRYECRLMEMAGSLGSTVTLTFDQMADPRE